MPTEFLKDIANKEFKAVENEKDPNFLSSKTGQGTDSNEETSAMTEALEIIGEHNIEMETDEEYMQRLMDETEAIRERNKSKNARIKADVVKNDVVDPEALKSIYACEPLDEVVMPLCQHDKILMESLKRGHVKAVNKNVAENLLRNYNVGLRVKHFEHKNDSPAEETIHLSALKTGLVNFTFKHVISIYCLEKICVKIVSI